MEGLIETVPVWIKGVALVLSALVVLATALVQLPPFRKYQPKVGKVKAFVDKIVHWLPTIGINPKTKDLEKKVEAKKE